MNCVVQKGKCVLEYILLKTKNGQNLFTKCQEEISCWRVRAQASTAKSTGRVLPRTVCRVNHTDGFGPGFSGSPASWRCVHCVCSCVSVAAEPAAFWLLRFHLQKCLLMTLGTPWEIWALLRATSASYARCLSWWDRAGLNNSDTQREKKKFYVMCWSKPNFLSFIWLFADFFWSPLLI